MRRFAVPHGLDLDELVDEISLFETKTSKEKIKRRIVFLLNSIIYGSVRESKGMEKQFHQERLGAHLKSKVLESVLGGNWFKYVQVLKDHKVIEVSYGYCPGKQSKKYFLCEHWSETTVDEIIEEDEEFINLIKNSFKKNKGSKISMQEQKDRKFAPKKSSAFKLIKGVLEQNKIIIDEEGARNWINDHCDQLLQSGEYKVGYQQAHPDHRRIVYHSMVDSFLEFDYNIRDGVDEFGGRFHSLLTYCPTGLRQFMSWGEEKLVALDLSNSQPYLLNVMFQKKFISSADTFSLRNLHPQFHAHLVGLKEKKKEVLDLEAISVDMKQEVEVSSKGSQLLPLFIMLEKVSQSQQQWGFQKVNFQSLVNDGTLYEFISEKFKGRYKEIFPPYGYRFSNRKSTKLEVLFMLYHQPGAKKSARIKHPYKQFVKLFPAQGNLINLLKSRDYKDAPSLLQRVESYLFLEKIAKPMIQKGIPVLTIHDSIVVPEKHKDEALNLMMSILKEFIGEEPSIKQERWGE